MEKFDRKHVESLAADLMLGLNDKEVETVVTNSRIFIEQINVLQGIDTTGVQEMSYPFEEELTWLRDDEVSHVIEQEVAFLNAPKTHGDYIEIVQVVEK